MSVMGNTPDWQKHLFDHRESSEQSQSAAHRSNDCGVLQTYSGAGLFFSFRP